jgi:hypothetical protein
MADADVRATLSAGKLGRVLSASGAGRLPAMVKADSRSRVMKDQQIFTVAQAVGPGAPSTAMYIGPQGTEAPVKKVPAPMPELLAVTYCVFTGLRLVVSTSMRTLAPGV